jgi:hypothetical protein
MKKLITLILFITVSVAQAQITITSADMPNSGDTIRLSIVSALTPVDLSLTGPNYTWDFSTFVPASQTVDSFVSVSTAGVTYSVYFLLNPPSPSYGQRGIDIPALGGLPISNSYSFKKESAANYSQVGYGGELTAGVAIPIKFNNPDVIYNFPLNFGDQDSSDSDFALAVSGTGYIAGNQHRVNNVDGWGTLITPYGTYNTLRVVSATTGHDTVYIDAQANGFAIDQPLTREYKWLANNKKIPVLQIITQEVLGAEVISSIRYQDTIQNITTGISQVSTPSASAIRLIPSSIKGSAIIRVNSILNSPVSVNVYDLTGRSIYCREMTAQKGINDLNISLPGIRNGIYIVQVTQNHSAIGSLRWVVAE